MRHFHHHNSLSLAVTPPLVLNYANEAHRPVGVTPESVEYYKIIGSALKQRDKVDGGINSIVAIILKQFRHFLAIETLQPPELKYISLLQEQALFPDSPFLIKNTDSFVGFLQETRKVDLVLNYLNMLVELKCIGHIPFVLSAVIQRDLHTQFTIVTKWDEAYRAQLSKKRAGMVEVTGGSLVDVSAFASTDDVAGLLTTEIGCKGLIYKGNIYRLRAVDFLTWMMRNERTISAQIKFHNWNLIYNEFLCNVNAAIDNLRINL